MGTRPPPKGRSTEDNVECLGLWLYGAEKTLISFAVVENKDVIVHMAVRLPTPGPSKDGLFCLINAWLSSIA
jgi:hypothetical protein